VPSSPSGTDLQWRDPATGDATERTVPVGTPGELISLVRYLLGFHPGGGDMVVMGTAPPGNRVRLTLRWDLPGPDVPALAAVHARHAIVVLAVNGCTQVAAVGFGPDQLVAPSVMVLREAATAAGLRTWDLLRADGGRYWSYQCDSPACCPPGGTPCSSAGGPTARRLTRFPAPPPRAAQARRRRHLVRGRGHRGRARAGTDDLPGPHRARSPAPDLKRTGSKVASYAAGAARTRSPAPVSGRQPPRDCTS
jgi:hypothetical protein